MVTQRVDLDLGDSHTLRFYVWAPDLSIPANAERYSDLPGSPDDKVGGIVGHIRPDGTYCEGAFTFDTPRTRRMSDNRPRWTVHSWDPLTLSPSLLCKAPVYKDGQIVGECGDHGFIREGRWVRA